MSSFYDDFREYTDPAKRVGWYDLLDQHLKYSFVEEMVLVEDSVVDLGSGLGDLSKFLADNGHTGEYIGVEKDVSLLQTSQNLHPGKNFHLQDFTKVPFHKADIAVCIGGLLSEDVITLKSVLGLLANYPKFILIGLSAEATSSLCFEPHLVTIPTGENTIRLNTSEIAVVHNCYPRRSPIQRLQDLICADSDLKYPDESVARAFYGLGEKDKALRILKNCKTELASAMLAAWE